MSTLQYILYANVLMLVSGSVYYIFLRNRIHHTTARMWIIITMLLSVFAPLAGQLIPAPEAVSVMHYTLPEINITSGQQAIETQHTPVANWPLILFLSISALTIIRYIAGLVRIGRYMRQHTYMRIGPFKYFSIPENAQPFSFFTMIFLPPTQHFTIISLHEEQHARLHHTLDILLSGFLFVLFWINPMYWLITNELRNIHEYQADEAVLASGTDMKQYQQILLTAAFGTIPVMPVSHLKQSTIKKRIIMMKQKKSFRSSALWLLPAVMLVSAAIWFTACGSKKQSESKTNDSAKTETSAKTDAGKTVPALDEVFEVTEKMPEFPGGNEALSQFMVKNIKYPKAAIEEGIQGTVYVDFIVNSEGKVTEAEIQKSVSPELDAEALRVINKMPNWTPAEQKGEKVSVHLTLPVKFKLQ